MRQSEWHQVAFQRGMNANTRVVGLGSGASMRLYMHPISFFNSIMRLYMWRSPDYSEKSIMRHQVAQRISTQDRIIYHRLDYDVTSWVKFSSVPFLCRKARKGYQMKLHVKDVASIYQLLLNNASAQEREAIYCQELLAPFEGIMRIYGEEDPLTCAKR